jgi:hypothetical protein
MAKINKLALARLTLRETISQLDNRELLCVLTDMYAGQGEEQSQPRWYGNGSGTSGLEQGIYNHMTTFRRVTNLWMKLQKLSPDIKQETYRVRDIVVEMLGKHNVDLKGLEAEESNE